MIVLGIDPGLSMAGWGVVEKGQKDKIKMLDYGCIKTYPSDKLTCRLKYIYDEIQVVISKYKPEMVAIEELFFLKGSKVIASVGQARGAILMAVINNNIPVFEYNPRHVKIALTGYGSADKHQMQHMVKAILGLKEIPKPDDSADALAMAICHLNTNRFFK
ncbi:MAG: crossover junction endodeoxyribonuclease RuvC [Endomicrobiaceae bacterium]|nr:crossover junction endodeoxyribonuclease RuvC [Endomicrobiaceae bacterium]